MPTIRPIQKLDFLSLGATVARLTSKAPLVLQARSLVQCKVIDTYQHLLLKSGSICLELEAERRHGLLLDLVRADATFHESFAPTSWRRYQGWALVSLGALEIERFEYLWKNKENKGIVRLWFTCLTGKTKVDFLCYEVLRGYEREAQELIGYLENHIGSVKGVDLGLLICQALEISMVKLKTPSLSPSSLVNEALSPACLAYLEQSQTMIEGICSDADIECLHEFRVQQRKVRSLLSIFKGSLSPDLSVLRAKLAQMMTASNQLRDLDVLLESSRDFLNLVAEQDKDNLILVFKEIEKQRNKAHKTLVSYLRSVPFKEDWKDLIRYLAPHSTLWSEESRMQTIRMQASLLLKKIYGRTAAGSLLLSSDLEASSVHDLRLQHKKLRYLLDFIIDLSARAEFEELREVLKTSQKYLGRYNDSVVQLEWFRNWMASKQASLPAHLLLSLKNLCLRLGERSDANLSLALAHAGESISAQTTGLVKNVTAWGRDQ